VFFSQESYLNYSNYDSILQSKTKMIKKYSIDLKANKDILKFPSLINVIEVTAQLNTAELKDTALVNPWNEA
jgi:hypothetical protein